MSKTDVELNNIKAFPKGAVVKVKDPDTFIASFANKLRDRFGEVVSHTAFYGNPIVEFAALGRRKYHRQTFQRPNELEIVTDSAAIAAWREELKKSADRKAVAAAKKVASKPVSKASK